MDTTIENFDYPDEESAPSVVETMGRLYKLLERGPLPLSIDPIIMTRLQFEFMCLPPLMKTKTRLMVKMGWLANRLLCFI